MSAEPIGKDNIGNGLKKQIYELFLFFELFSLKSITNGYDTKLLSIQDMIARKGTQRQQMMRCYLLGYLTTRHNEYKLVAESSDFNSHKRFKQFGAEEKLIEYGMPRGLAKVVVKVAPRFELFLSISMCIYMFFNYSVKFLKHKRKKYYNTKFFPKLNFPEARAINLYCSAGYSINDLVAIDIPGQYVKYNKVKKVSVFSGISYSQLLLSFIYSIRLCWFMIHKYRYVDMLFRSYSSFPFFLCFYFIENLDRSNEIVYYNHYDRWMYLMGNSCLHKTYIQHGKLWRDYISRISCDVAYYISKSQQEILEFTLFNNKPEVRFRKIFEYSGLERLKNNGKKNILVICQTLFLSEQENVLHVLNNIDVNIYLKPHPMDNYDIYENYQKQNPNIVILERFEYPKVDYVISYDSTLADEYEMHDIPILRYNDEDYSIILSKLFAECK